MSRNCIPDCPCQEDNVLKFSVQEINKILASAPINCSQRYATIPGQILYLSLEEALPLVDEKERTVGKGLTFLNHSAPPAFELWYFMGSTVGDWFDQTQWVSIPVPTQAGLAKYLLSSTVKEIEVVEKAPSILDNVLYFQYDTLAEHSTYDFELIFNDKLEAGKAIAGILTLYTSIIGLAGYDKVRVVMGVTTKPQGATVTGTVRDYDGNSYEFNNSAWISPATGIPVDIDEEEIYELDLTFSAIGTYVINIKLVNSEGGETLTDVNYQVDIEASNESRIWKL